MSQYEIGDTLAHPVEILGSLLLPPSEIGKGKDKSNEHEEIRTKSDASIIESGHAQRNGGELCSDSGNHSPFSLTCCCGSCGEKGRI
jgi:hypothetical protein